MFLGSDLAAFSGADVPLQTSTMSLTESNMFPSFGESVTFTATVSAGSRSANSPTGEVWFYAVPVFGGNNVVLGTVNLPADGSDQATLTTSSVPVGDYNVIAFYGGDNNFATCNNPADQSEMFVVPNSTTTTLTSPGAAVAGQAVTLTAAVAPRLAPAAAGTPTGYVSFYAGATLLGVAALPSGGLGQVSITTSSLPAGNNRISAIYSGDNNFETSKGYLTEKITKSSALAALHGASVLRPASITAMLADDGADAKRPLNRLR